MKFIHIADLHLGARTEAKLDAKKADQRRGELIATFASIAALADAEGAAILIAGDLFDAKHPLKKTVNAFLDIVRLHPNVRFFTLPGNHEGGEFPAADIPENLSVFGNRWQTYSYGDTDIHGVAPEGALSLEGFSPNPERRNVVLLHGAIREGERGEAGEIPLGLLRDRGIDYLALGHYHSHRSERLDSRGIYAYSGTPEGRGMDEAGECGFLMVDTTHSPTAVAFHAAAKRQIHIVELDITGAEGQAPAILALAKEKTAHIPAGDLLRIVLVGGLSPDCPRPSPERLQEALATRFYYLEVKDKTTLAINPGTYRDSLTLKGEFVRQVMASDMSDEERSAVLRVGFAALCGEEDDI